MEELKLCPFCGGKAVLDDKFFVCVYCLHCNNHTATELIADKAVKAWNRRFIDLKELNIPAICKSCDHINCENGNCMYTNFCEYQNNLIRKDIRTLYHVTTVKKAKLYRQTGHINKPVRGFDSLMGAMVWAIKTGRKIIYAVSGEPSYLLPDHHNDYGKAYWIDENIPVDRIKCVYSAEENYNE